MPLRITPGSGAGGVGTETDPVAEADLATHVASSTAHAALFAAKAMGLTPTPIKTANYTSGVGDLARFDTTSGPLTNTLPTAPADKSVAGAKVVTLGAGNGLTVATGGSDVINKPGGGTSTSLTMLGHAVILQYNASDAAWVVHSTDVPVSQLDLRYQSISTRLAELAALNTNSTVPEQVGGVWVARSMASLKSDLALVKADVGLGSVDNTADTAKPVSTAQQTALDAKAAATHAAQHAAAGSDPISISRSQITDVQQAVVTANQTAITSQTTLQNITALGLTLGVSATEIWLVKYWLILNAANATMDAKIGFTVPSGCTMRWGTLGNSSAGLAAWGGLGTASSVTIAAIESTVISFGTPVGNALLPIVAVVMGGGTAGTVQIQYAQATSDAGNLFVAKGSAMEATRLAT